MVGSSVVATLPKGREIVVVEVRDPWVGVFVSVDGQRKAGWLRNRDFLPPAEQGGRESPGPAVAGPAGPETPAAMTGASAQPCFCNSPSPGYGYNVPSYRSHEPDPDIHQWEPWRY
jgi:hypothetical protein